jgi:hypothetical protein
MGRYDEAGAETEGCKRLAGWETGGGVAARAGREEDGSWGCLDRNRVKRKEGARLMGLVEGIIEGTGDGGR